MRYILDENGYVELCSATKLVCEDRTCTEYTGSIPDGYETIEEWAKNANIRAYKVIDGELVYDANKDAELQAQYELDASNNACASVGYVNDKFSKSSTIYDDNMTKTTNDLVIKDAGEYEIPEIVIEGTGDLKTATNKIEDARAGKSKGIKVTGKSIQDGTPSPDAPIEIKNVEGVTNLCPTDISMWESGHYHTDGNKLGNGARIRTIDLIPIAPNTYFGTTLKSGYVLIIRTYDKDKKFLRSIGIVDNSVFTINNGESYIGVSIGESTNNVTYDTYIRLFENNELKPLILLNSVKETNFIPYGRWLEVKSIGKNLFNKDDVVQGYLNANGNISNNSTDKTSGFIKVQPNTTYTRQISNNNACYDENKNFISVKYSKQFTTPSNCKYVRITSLITNLDIEQLEIGNVSTDYEPYKETTALVDMNNYDEEGNITSHYELCAIGDIKDTFKDGVLTQRIGKVVLDGSENWNVTTSEDSRRFWTNIIIDKVVLNSKSVCNCFIEDVNYEYFTNGKFRIAPSGAITFCYTDALNINEWKAYLKEQYDAGTPVIVEYVLATPIEHNLNYEVLELHEGYNNITTNDELETDIDITYIAQTTTLEDGLKVQVSNDNQLVNEVLNHSINGLKVEVNEDKSITINGTATADTEIVLNGSNENVEPIFMLNDKNKFTLSGLTDDITLNLYNYNGTDKTLLFSGTSGEVNIEGTQYITYSTLSIASGVKVNATITPMITANNEEYVAAKLNNILDIVIDELEQHEQLKIDRSCVTLVDTNTKKKTKLKMINSLNSFDPITLIQTNQERLKLTTKYFPNDYLNERFAEVKVEQDNIKSEVSATYITKVDSANNISTAKTEAISSANSSTDNKLKNYTNTTNMNSAIDTAKGEAIDSANSSTDEKLKSYSTTTEMNNAITQKVNSSENSIKLEVANTYTTKEETTTAKNDAINSANSSTDEKLESYSTTKEINAALELKINKDDLVSEFNAKANVITLTSDNFKLDANGRIIATSGKVGGWEIGKDYLYNDYSDGTYDYRAYLQPILDQSGTETWVYSIQKKKTSDTDYAGIYYVKADGSITTEGNIGTTSDIIANGQIISHTGFLTGNSYLAPNGAYVEGQIASTDNIFGKGLFTPSEDALHICGYGGNKIGGSKGIWLSTTNNITLNPLEGSAYVRIGTGSSYKISTAGGNLSSLNLKENLKEFKEEDYNDAIDLLREIDLYNFDYKYDINSYENNYGFIIDFIKENDKTNKFFNFNQYKAVVNENKTLDEAKAQEEPDNENIIEYERYSEESLVKYLLTICKAQQKQIDELNERLTTLEESIKALN